MKDAPAFDFYPERWLAGVADLTDADQAVYIRLLCHSWLRDGLPAEQGTLKRLAGTKVSPAVLAKFHPGEDGFLRNARQEKIRSDQRARIAKAKSKSAKMHTGRYGGKQSPSSAASSSQAASKQCCKQPPSSPQAVLEGCPPPTNHPKEKESTARLAEVIANAYPRRDSPSEVLDLITCDLDAGQDAETMLQAVHHVAKSIQSAPGGASNKYVPKALNFFANRDWKSPESFDQRWRPPAETNHKKRITLNTQPNNGW